MIERLGLFKVTLIHDLGVVMCDKIMLSPNKRELHRRLLSNEKLKNYKWTIEFMRWLDEMEGVNYEQ